MGKGFIDILFILLCGTIVMLSQSLQIGSVDIDPAKVGTGGTTAINPDDIQLVVVTENALQLVAKDGGENITANSVSELKNLLDSECCILLSVENEKVSHQKVMSTWSQCQQAGWQVKLAAQEEDNSQERN